MKNTFPSSDKKYILPKIFRVWYIVFGITLPVILLGLAFIFLYNGSTQNVERYVYFIIAAVFACGGIGCFVFFLKTIPIVNAVYTIDEIVATNATSTFSRQVTVSADATQTFDYNLIWGKKIKFQLECTIISATLSAVELSMFEGMHIVNIIKKIWETSSVIIPKTER